MDSTKGDMFIRKYRRIGSSEFEYWRCGPTSITEDEIELLVPINKRSISVYAPPKLESSEFESETDYYTFGETVLVLGCYSKTQEAKNTL